MISGIRHLRSRPAASAVLAAQAAHRLLFGLLSIMTLLLYRNHYRPGDPDGAIVGLLGVAAATALGSLIAAVITPPLVRRLGTVRWLVLLTLGLAVFVPSVGLVFLAPLTVVASLLVSLGAQGTKIVTDTTLQVEIEDDYRGRVFSVNDTGFSLMYVVGLLIGALVLPASGVSVATMIAAGLGYALIALGYGWANRRATVVTRT
jgi:MFS family permease